MKRIMVIGIVLYYKLQLKFDYYDDLFAKNGPKRKFQSNIAVYVIHNS